MELADLERHVVDRLIEVVIKDSEIPLHGLNGSREVEVKSKHDEDVRLQVDELLLAHKLFLIVSEKVDHSGETR